MKGESRFATPGDCSIFILRLDVVVHIRRIHTRMTSCRIIDNPSGLSSGFKGIALPIAERKSSYFFSALCTVRRDASLRLDFRERLLLSRVYFADVVFLQRLRNTSPNVVHKIRRLRYSLFLLRYVLFLFYVNIPFSKHDQSIYDPVSSV